jgi:hypothetical protein
MARNQKRDARSQMLRNYALFAVSVGIITVMVMGFVLQRRAHNRLGTLKRSEEVRIAELRRQTNDLAIALARCSNPTALVQKAEPLGLVKISASQRLFVTLPGAAPSRGVARTGGSNSVSATRTFAPGPMAATVPR